MNLLTQVFTIVGAIVCIVPVVLIAFFTFAHFLAKAILRRKAKLTLS